MNHSMNYTEMLIQSLSHALLHSLWQGALIGIALWITLKAFNRLGSDARYALSYSALFLVLGSFLYTLIRKWISLQNNEIVSGVTVPLYPEPLTTIAQANTIAKASSIPQFQWIFPWLVLFYLIGVIFFTARFVVGIVHLKTLRYRQTALPGPAIKDKLQQLAHAMGIKRPVQILLTHRLETPVVFGTLKPMILLPFASAMQLSPDQLEAILIHELAHIRRNDYLLNMFQLVAETILFFHPFVWLISAIIRREREHCCDDTVLSMTTDTLPYAKALAMLETYRSLQGSPALAAGGNKYQLFNRIKRITTMKKQKMNYSQLTAATILLIVLGISVAYFTPAFAQNKKEDKKTGNSNHTINKQKTIIKVIDDEGNVNTYDSENDLPAEVQEKLKGKNAMTQHHTYKITKTLDSADMEEITESIQKSQDQLAVELKKMDIDNIVDNSLAEVDWKEIDKQLQEAGKSDKIRVEVMTSVNKAMKEVNESMKEIDWEEIGKEIRKSLDEARAAKTEADITIRRAHGARDAARAQRSIALAAAAGKRVNGLNFNKMLDKMEADGLINREDGFKIKKMNGRLYINGEEQYDEVYNRYKPYLKGDVITIKGNEDNLNVKIKN